MKKISYRNKSYKRLKPVSGPIPSDTTSEEGYSANFPGIGRGFALPGEQAISMPDNETDKEFLPENGRKGRSKYNEMLDLFVELGGSMDEQGEYALASFADFLIKKIAQQNSVDYESMLKDLVLKISNSDISNKNNFIITVGKIYNDKYLELAPESGEVTAHREAYQAASNLAEGELGSPHSIGGIEKQAQILEKNPVYVAEQIASIIAIMINNMSPDVRQRSFGNVKNKIKDFNVMEISNKRAPGGAAIGVSLGLIKNILNGKDPYFINTVLSELSIRL